MSLTIGTHTFDRVNYDADGDVLYLHKGDALTDADWDETPEATASASTRPVNSWASQS